jgi:hypothetical protein
MPNTLVIALLAGGLAVAGSLACALELPDFGSKNFSPSGDTPTYFTNETAPVAARTADTTANDWSAIDAVAPESSPAVSSTHSLRHSGRHARQVSGQKSAKHTMGKPRSAHSAVHSGRSGGSRTTAAAPARNASRKPVWAASVKGSRTSSSVSAAKGTTGKHGKPATRHARAEANYPIVSPGAAPL